MRSVVEAAEQTAHLRLAQSGDRDSLEMLLADLRPGVFRYCLARLGDRHLADDVTQEVCIAVVNALPAYRDEGRPFSAFVFSIAARKVADAFRAAARSREDSTAELPDVHDVAVGPEEHALKGAAYAHARRLLAELPEQQREIVFLRVAAGLTAEETAAVVGISPGAVRVTQHRALAQLRRRLAEESS